MTPPIEVFASIERLKGNADFDRIVAWLESQLADEIASLLQAPKDSVLQQQGFTAALDELMTIVKSSRTAMERHSSSGTVNT